MTNSPGRDDRYLETIRSTDHALTAKKMAWAELYITYYPLLLKYAIRTLKLTDEDAEDVVHDTLTKALFTKKEQFTSQGDGSFFAWMCRILKNQHINIVKSARVARTSSYDEKPELLDDQVVSLHISNQQTYKDADLSDLECLVIELHIDHCLPPREIIEIIPGQTTDNISRTIYRAKEKLRKFLSD